MGAPRRFDHDEARRRFAAGETVTEISRELGVSFPSVKRAVDPVYREQERNRKTQAFAAMKRPCLGGCGKTVWAHHNKARMASFTGLCPACFGKSRITAPHGTESRYTHGCRCDPCREAASAGRRRRRLANPEARRAYDRARYQRLRAA